MQSCARRWAATIGVIQMSPRQWHDAGWIERQEQSSVSGIVRYICAVPDADLGAVEHRGRRGEGRMIAAVRPLPWE